GKIQNWQPVPPDKVFTFETTVGEKVLLRIEGHDAAESPYQGARGTNKRKHTAASDDFRSRQSHVPAVGAQQQRQFHHQGNFAGAGGAGGRGGAAGRGGFRGGGGGGGG